MVTPTGGSGRNHILERLGVQLDGWWIRRALLGRPGRSTILPS